MTTQIFFLIFSFLVNAKELGVDQLQDFATDGCTASPNGTWMHCCYEHDIAYWVGGDFNDRLKADERLLWCMNKSGGLGHVYFDFVRTSGAQFWGWAWPDQRLNPNPNEKEIEAINAERELWHNLGMPHNYNFINYETTMFSKLNKSERNLIKLKFEPVKKSAEFIQFMSTYKETMGELPVLP